MAKERLDKVLGHLGVGTRKEIHRLARSGLITVDGETITDAGYKFDPAQARVRWLESVIISKVLLPTA